jgi:hypothetical protein
VQSACFAGGPVRPVIIWRRTRGGVHRTHSVQAARIGPVMPAKTMRASWTVHSRRLA